MDHQCRYNIIFGLDTHHGSLILAMPLDGARPFLAPGQLPVRLFFFEFVLGPALRAPRVTADVLGKQTISTRAVSLLLRACFGVPVRLCSWATYCGSFSYGISSCLHPYVGWGLELLIRLQVCGSRDSGQVRDGHCFAHCYVLATERRVSMWCWFSFDATDMESSRDEVVASCKIQC